MSINYPVTVYNWPTTTPSSGGTEIAFDWAGIPTKVEYQGNDYPGNSIPLPANPVNLVSGDFITPASNIDIVQVVNQISYLGNQLPTTIGQKTSAGSLSVVLASDATAAPISYQIDGTATPVNIDTLTPSSSKILPVGLYSTSSGNLFDPDTFVTKTDINLTNGYL